MDPRDVANRSRRRHLGVAAGICGLGATALVIGLSGAASAAEPVPTYYWDGQPANARHDPRRSSWRWTGCLLSTNPKGRLRPGVGCHVGPCTVWCGGDESRAAVAGEAVRRMGGDRRGSPANNVSCHHRGDCTSAIQGPARERGIGGRAGSNGGRLPLGPAARIVAPVPACSL